MRKHKLRKWVGGLCAALPVAALGLLFFLPIGILVSGSIADAVEWQGRLEPMLKEGEGFIGWRWIPDYPTGEHFKRLLFYSPGFLHLFWNSIWTVGTILAGQLLMGVPAAWAFAAFSFRGRRTLFQLYIILMLLPFQVTMLSRYLVLRELSLLNTSASVILPAVFSTFPVFLVYRSFRGIPRELLEAARMDGAGEGRIFRQIGLPLAKGGLSACFVLSFLESWNMMEEPLAFLKDKALWPLSLYLPEISLTQAGFAAAASMITLTVSLFVFGLFRDSLEQGIAASGIKA
ncbi:MAG: carbohydrate ABC transporter permease [Butyrivibrio sp.]|nr:carbohydrate ABC transporter permease [Muribaculum sp.]MCM1553684.1 carbohydrate ABC transporter permease [Butyrivibrio sp.]